MDFDKFREYIPKILIQTLPGETSHFKMAPPERKEIIKTLNIDELQLRKAAIMMLVYPKKERAHLVLIVRNAYKGVHSSQIAFPGGKVEPDDFSFEYTALRETEEEIGIDKEGIKIIRPFSRVYIPPSNFLVYPFLGYSESELEFLPSEREVAAIIELPLDVFLDDATIFVQSMPTSYSESVEVPTFKIGDHYVWGATAMMLSELKDVLKSIF